MDTFRNDLRFAFRMLTKAKGFTVAAVLLLALGIGANTAIFSLVDGFLLRLLPLKDPKQLVFVRATQPEGKTTGAFPYPTFEQFRDHSSSFDGMFALDGSRVSVTVEGNPEMVWGDFVSGNYFELLGVRTVAGRTFNVDDDRPGKPPVAVISYGYWEQRFGRDAAAIGKTIYLGKIPFVIVGVTPSDFSGLNVAGGSAELILPMTLQPQLALRDHNKFDVVARLKAGASIDSARDDLDAIYQQVLSQSAAVQTGASEIEAQKIELKPGLRGYSTTDDDFAAELRILFAVAGVVLLIAAVNVASLLLARASSRQKEIAIRLSVGASRGRLIRQLLTESTLLAILGGGLGLLFAMWGVDLLVRVLSYGQSSPILYGLRINSSVLAFNAVVSILTGILFGLIPAYAATRVDLNCILKGADTSRQRGRSRFAIGKSLVVAQVALSLALLIGAGLLIRSLQRLSAIDTGFEREKVLTMWAYPALIGYDHQREIALYGQVLDKLNATPGVQSATLSRYSVLNNAGPVAPRFFETMGIALLRGREFTDRDIATSPKVAVITDSTARRVFPNEDPIGKRFNWRRGGGINLEPVATGGVEIVGLAKDLRRSLRSEGRPDEGFYLPYTQAPPEMLGQAVLLVRTLGGPATLIPAIRSSVQSVEKDLALLGIKTEAQEIEDRYLGSERALATLLTFFGVLAVALASIGLYGTMSYSVERRTKELGIRMALGAQRKDMISLVLRETMTLLVIGIAIGIPVAIAAGRLISSLLFGIGIADPVTIGIAALAMFVIALAAGYLPARRATKIDPMIALRYE